MSKVEKTARITTAAAGVGEEGEVLDEGQVRMATMTMTTALEMAAERLEGAMAEGVVLEVLQRREEEEEDEDEEEGEEEGEVNRQREELSLVLPKIVCLFSLLSCSQLMI